MKSEPAFPLPILNVEGITVYSPNKAFNGLSKREYFAACALRGVIAAIAGDKHLAFVQGIAAQDNTTTCEVIAKMSVNMANALIAELEKESK